MQPPLQVVITAPDDPGHGRVPGARVVPPAVQPVAPGPLTAAELDEASISAWAASLTSRSEGPRRGSRLRTVVERVDLRGAPTACSPIAEYGSDSFEEPSHAWFVALGGIAEQREPHRGEVER